jgi:hypothetical protein
MPKNKTIDEGKFTLWQLILIYFAYIGTLLMWGGIFLLSILALDDAGFNWPGVIGVFFIFSYLPVVIWASIISWKNYKSAEFSLAKKNALLPFIYPAIFYLLIAFM